MFNFCIRNRPLAPILCLGFMSCDESDGENREDNATTIPSSLIAQHNISLITIQSGHFLMGSSSDDIERNEDETQHSVTLTRDFQIAQSEVTQALWEEVMETQPWISAENTTGAQCLGGVPPIGEDLAVRCISWVDAINFCNRLSEREGLVPVYEFPDGRDEPTWNLESDGYRLPSEAEWEYAARNQANLLGMQNGPAEWVWDWYVPFIEGAVIDPTGGMLSLFDRSRVFRSNSAITNTDTDTDTDTPTRIAARGHLSHQERANNLGLRIARNSIDQ